MKQEPDSWFNNFEARFLMAENGKEQGLSHTLQPIESWISLDNLHYCQIQTCPRLAIITDEFHLDKPQISQD